MKTQHASPTEIVCLCSISYYLFDYVHYFFVHLYLAVTCHSQIYQKLNLELFNIKINK